MTENECNAIRRGDRYLVNNTIGKLSRSGLMRLLVASTKILIPEFAYSFQREGHAPLVGEFTTCGKGNSKIRSFFI